MAEVKKPFVKCKRSDALGCRMIALLSAFWTAKKLGYNFYFSWLENIDFFVPNKTQILESLKKEDKNARVDLVNIIPAREIFAESFLKEHLIDETHGLDLNFPYGSSLESLKEMQEVEYSQGCTPDVAFSDVDKSSWQEIAEIYKNDIAWSKKASEVLNAASAAAKERER